MDLGHGMDLGKLTMTIAANPALCAIPLDRLLFFLASIPILKDDILLIQPSGHSIACPPSMLPASMQSFFSKACNIPMDAVQELWSAFKDVAWNDVPLSAVLSAPLSTFHAHGLSNSYSMYSFFVLCSTNLIIHSWPYTLPPKSILLGVFLSSYAEGDVDDACQTTAMYSLHRQ